MTRPPRPLVATSHRFPVWAAWTCPLAVRRERRPGPGRSLALRGCKPSTGAASPASAHLTAKIRTFIDGWNDRAHPFVWTKTAEQILTKAGRKKTLDAAH